MLEQLEEAVRLLKSAAKEQLRWAQDPRRLGPAPQRLFTSLSCWHVPAQALITPSLYSSKDFTLADPPAWKFSPKLSSRLALLVIRSTRRYYLCRAASLRNKLKQFSPSHFVTSPHLIFLMAFMISETTLFFYWYICLLSTSSCSPRM